MIDKTIEVERMEHVISAESFEKLKAHLDEMEAADGDAQPQE